MGTDRRHITVITEVSRHNHPKDHVHDALHDLLTAEINAVVKDPKYAPIHAEVQGWDGY